MRLAEARRLVQRMDAAADPFFHPVGDLTALLLGAGDRDAAFAQIERGFAGRSYDMLYLDRDPRFAELRNNPASLFLRKRVSLAN